MNYDPIHDTYALAGDAPPDAMAQSPHIDPSVAHDGDRRLADSGSPDDKLAIDQLVATQSNDTDSASQAEPDSPGSDNEPGQLPANFRAVSKGFKHLKKADGEPFWRKDIQYDFLEELFNDTHRVFTNCFPYCEVPNAANGPKLTFAELYVRTLAESLKSSRVLRERLIKDAEMGIAVSKVCLLVNAGRMNTTVNFVPDMRSALRTYHLIPSLQADPDGPSKPLQDTPRLKTILKAVCDGQDHLQTLLDLWRAPPATKPNTNVIKLIFLMSTFFQNIPFHYDDSFDHDTFLEKLRFIKASPGPQNKFMEFFLNDEIYPHNRAQRFLWLVYTYLETSFTAAELEQNPFNPRVIPPIEYIPAHEMGKYDNDADYEVEYAARMYHTRMLHLNDEVNNTFPKRGNKSKRERQKIRKQLILEHNYRPTPENPDEDTADDMMAIDDTLQAEEQDAMDEVEPLEEPKNVVQRADKGKRKKPTPSVGSLVDDSKKPLDAEFRWSNPEIPIKKIASIRRRWAPYTKGITVHPLTRDSAVSVFKKRNIVNKTKLFIAQIAKVTPDFVDRRDENLEWMHRYFHYKKATGNRLLGMEWEDIRSDLVNGVETYLYQQIGKALVLKHYDEQLEDERLESGDRELLKRENLATGVDVLPADVSPVEISAIDKVGGSYVTNHDFDNASERTVYEHLVLELVEDTIAQNKFISRPKVEKMVFNLDTESVLFA